MTISSPTFSLLLRCLIKLLGVSFALSVQAQTPESRSVAPAVIAQAERTRSAAAPVASPRRVALVIGNGKYRQLPVLPNPGNDANDICAALRLLNFSAICRLDIADRAEFRQVVRQFASQLGPDTLALFYFAGHAVQLRGDNFLLPTGVAATNQLDLEDDSLALSHVLRVLEEARSAPNIVLIDACRDDPFERTGSRLGTSKGLARVDPPVGSLLVYATAPGAVALDGEGRNGLFTKHLLANLKHASMPLSELLQQVASDVETEARTRYRFQQVPYRSFSYSGNLCLADCDDQRASVQLAELKRRSDAAMERMRALEEENARLTNAAGMPSGGASSKRELELSELRQMLREYQQRIGSLEREAAERGKARGIERPQSAETRPRPVVVPSF